VFEVAGLLRQGEQHWVTLVSRAHGDARLFREHQMVGDFTITSIREHSVVVAAADRVLEIELGDLFIPWRRSAVPSSCDDAHDVSSPVILDLVTLISVAGAAQDVDGRWTVCLRRAIPYEVLSLNGGDHRGGYRATLVTDIAAILTPVAAVDDPVRNSSAAETNVSARSVPDLVRTPSRDRAVWLRTWLEDVSNLPESERGTARRRMRDYWQQQFAGPWGQAVSALLTADQQQQLRTEIATYWQWR
jgi:hypothetical protein